MGRARHCAGLIALLASSAWAQQGPPVYVSTPAAPSGSCTGTRVWATSTVPSTLWCCQSGTWTDCTPAGGGGGGAPTTAQYWVGAADGTLSAEKNLGALGTALVVNTAGVPSAYAGSSCAAGQSPNGIGATGGVTGCQAVGGSYTLPAATTSVLGGVTLPSGTPTASKWWSGNGAWTAPTVNQIAQPTGDGNWAFPSGTKFLWTFTGSTDNAFSIDGDGSFTGTGDLVHIHKSGTGSSAGADALHLEVTSDVLMTALHINNVSTAPALVVNGATTLDGAGNLATTGAVTAARFAGPLTGAVTGNASTATALSTTGAANQFWATGNVWAQPSFSNLSGSATAAQIPTASTTLGGVKMAAACAAGNHVGSIVAGELTCSADAGGGGGADALGRYLVQISTNAPANAQVMASLATGLVKNTTTTGVQSIAAAGTDYGPPTSGNATGLVLSTTGTGAHTAYAGATCTNQFPRVLSASGAPTCASVDLSADTAATVLPMTKGGTGANLTGVVGGVLWSTSTTVTGQTAAGAAGTILANSSANTPAWLAAGTAGQVLSSRGAAAPVYVGVQTCTSSASTTCTITVARSGCTPVCQNSTAVSTWVRGTVATTTLTCTFSTSGTNTCACFCP